MHLLTRAGLSGEAWEWLAFKESALITTVAFAPAAVTTPLENTQRSSDPTPHSILKAKEEV